MRSPALFKTDHRDMGRALATWDRWCEGRADLQDPVPGVTTNWWMTRHRSPEGQGSRLRLSIPQLVITAWHRLRRSAAATNAAAPTGRASACSAEGLGSEPAGRTGEGAAKLERSRRNSTPRNGASRNPLADLIVLAGSAAVRKLRKGRPRVKVPFAPGAWTRRRSRPMWSRLRCWNRCRRFPELRPQRYRGLCRESADRQGAIADAYGSRDDGSGWRTARAECKLRASEHGVFTKRPGTLTNDFFVNLLDMNTKWRKSAASEGVLEGAIGRPARSMDGTIVDLSRVELATPSPGGSLCQQRRGAGVVQDFVAAWSKVMNLDRLISRDLRASKAVHRILFARIREACCSPLFHISRRDPSIWIGRTSAYREPCRIMPWRNCVKNCSLKIVWPIVTEQLTSGTIASSKSLW